MIHYRFEIAMLKGTDEANCDGHFFRSHVRDSCGERHENRLNEASSQLSTSAWPASLSSALRHQPPLPCCMMTDRVPKQKPGSRVPRRVKWLCPPIHCNSGRLCHRHRCSDQQKTDRVHKMNQSNTGACVCVEAEKQNGQTQTHGKHTSIVGTLRQWAPQLALRWKHIYIRINYQQTAFQSHKCCQISGLI